jgi:hypothetical protein
MSSIGAFSSAWLQSGGFSPIYEISAADSAENSDSTLDHFSGLAILEIFGNDSRRRMHLGLGLAG